MSQFSTNLFIPSFFFLSTFLSFFLQNFKHSVGWFLSLVVADYLGLLILLPLYPEY